MDNLTQNVYVTLFTGSDWHGGTGEYKSLGVTHSSNARRFSAAYEQESGQLLIVMSDGAATNRIKYWVWNRATSAWVVNGSTYTFDPGTISR